MELCPNLERHIVQIIVRANWKWMCYLATVIIPKADPRYFRHTTVCGGASFCLTGVGVLPTATWSLQGIADYVRQSGMISVEIRWIVLMFSPTASPCWSVSQKGIAFVSNQSTYAAVCCCETGAVCFCTIFSRFDDKLCYLIPLQCQRWLDRYTFLNSAC